MGGRQRTTLFFEKGKREEQEQKTAKKGYKKGKRK